MNRPPLQQGSSAINLRRLSVLRNIAIFAQTLTVFGVYFGLGVALPLGALGSIILAQALLNLFTWLRLGSSHRVTERELFAQLLLDVAALTALLYFSGGSTNPFVLLYLVPLTLTAAALPWLYAWIMMGVTTACYTLLMFAYVPLSHAAGMHDSDFDLHVMGMWVGFVVGAGLIAYFAVQMANTLRERDRMLASMREQALRNERIIALGGLAAGAAHELGTPLSTMAVVVKELDGEMQESPGVRSQLRILREQIDRCKAILSTLSASAGGARAEAGRRLALDVYLDDVRAQWHAMRPKASLQCRWDGPRPGPQILAERTLTQAITSILNNAADASPDIVEVDGRWSGDELVLEVCDRGPGLTQEEIEIAGKYRFTTKDPEEGLGLGLLLAQAMIERLGGSVHMYNRSGGGACVRIVLPLSSLLIACET